MIRSIVTTIIVSIILLLPACMSIPDPVKYEEKNNASLSKIAPKKILIIFDINIESSIFAYEKHNVNMPWGEKTYGQVAKNLVNKINAQGIDAEYKLHTSPLPYQLPATGYTHVLIEKLLQFTNVRDSYGSNFVKSRLWNAKLLEIATPTSEKPLALYEQTFTADGVSCWRGSLYANNADCQKKYIDLLMNQFTPIGITNKPEIPASQ